jgi:hypothetical protein
MNHHEIEQEIFDFLQSFYEDISMIDDGFHQYFMKEEKGYKALKENLKNEKMYYEKELMRINGALEILESI